MDPHARRRGPGCVRRFLARSSLLAVLASSGCADGEEETGTHPASHGTFRVALLLAGDEHDAGWNQAAWEGLQRIEEELGAAVLKVRAVTGTEIEAAFERAAERGYQLVIGHGAEFNLPASRIAARYPDTHFATTGGTNTASNLSSISFAVEQPAYQLGVLAGHLSESGVVSSISGQKLEPVVRVVRGFEQGLRSVRPEARLLIGYVGSWEDSIRAKEMALTHADEGADIFFQNADSAGVGVFEACRSRGALAFGCNRDQSAKAPDLIIASAVADIPGTLLTLARDVLEGRADGGPLRLGMKEGKTRLVFNPQLRERVPREASAAAEQAGARILSGEIDPGAS